MGKIKSVSFNSLQVDVKVLTRAKNNLSLENIKNSIPDFL
jgi:hypothetical protein